MDRRFLTVLAVSLLFALVVSGIFYQMSARAGNSTKKGPEPKSDLRDVVIAARPLPVGMSLKPADVKLVKVPVDQFPKGAFSKVEEVIDRPVVSNVLAEEPILDGRLAARGSGLGLAPIIPVGMRAQAVRVNDVNGVAGFVLPGMHVDVLVTGRPPSGSSTMTATLLQNLLVLSAGQTIQPDPRGQVINAPTVTLLVTPDQAEVLTLASSQGQIQLSLRNGSDTTIEKTHGQDLNELFGGRRAARGGGEIDPKPRPRPAPKQVAVVMPPPPPPPPVVAKPVLPPPPDEVVVIRGAIKTVEAVRSANPDQGASHD